jgi:hypothetical protein
LSGETLGFAAWTEHAQPEKKPLRDAEDKFNVPTNCRKKRFKEPPVLKATMSGWESRFFLAAWVQGQRN